MNTLKEFLKIYVVLAIQYSCSIGTIFISLALLDGDLPESNIYIRYTEIIICMVMGLSLIVYSSWHDTNHMHFFKNKDKIHELSKQALIKRKEGMIKYLEWYRNELKKISIKGRGRSY